jgi:putative serine protease PepD
VSAGSGGTGIDATAGRGTTPPAWWSDALNDPWRNPASNTVIVESAPPGQPPIEPMSDVAAEPRRDLRTLVIVAVITGLLAGALGGAIGFVAATHRGAAPVVLGSGPRSVVPPPRAAGSTAALVTRVLPSVVTIQGPTDQGTTLGSGFVITADGYLLTNDHVVTDVADNAVTVTLSDSTMLPGRIVGRDPESDLAVVKVDRGGLTPVELGDSDQVAVGDDVLAIGSPLALTGTVTKGIVSALDRTIETQDAGEGPRYYDAIQTDAAINRGNSGGPLFDSQGRVIGINSVIKSVIEDGAETGNIGIAFAVPINQAIRVATQLIKTGHARRTVIGAEFEAPTTAGGGVRLSTVDGGGPAATAGLRVGDVVTKLDGHLIVQAGDLIALVRNYDPGTVVEVAFRRGTATQSTKVTLVADAN